MMRQRIGHGRAAPAVGSFSGSRGERFRLIAFLLFLAACLFGGGASREDVLSLLYLRPLAILFIAATMLSPGPFDFRTFRVPFLLLAALAAIILVQLIPLPPDVWLSLPGRERYAEAAAAAGIPQPWRPISLTPFLTLNSLLALLVPLAVLIGMAGLREHQHRFLLPLLIGAACVSALLGIVQLGGGWGSPFHLYSITHQGSAVGFFSNRNHQAALLALAFPMLRIWTLSSARDPQYRRFRFWVAVAIGVMLIPMILVTGSRAGMALGAIGLVAAYFISGRSRSQAGGEGWRKWLPRLALWLLPPLFVAAVILRGRAVAVERLLVFLGDVEGEQRLRAFPVLLKMIGDFFPLGTGFGSFDRAYRGYEPDAELVPLYFNRAHNDLLELALTGGLPAVLVLCAFLAWYVWRSAATFRPIHGRADKLLLARLGSVMVLMLFIASLVDYPLRTPLMAAIFAIACGWLAQGSAARPSRSGDS